MTRTLAAPAAASVRVIDASSSTPPQRVFAPPAAEDAPPGGLVVLGEAPELVRRGAAEARLEAAALHPAVRDIARADPERRGVHDLLRRIVQLGEELVVTPLEAHDDERRVGDRHG